MTRRQQPRAIKWVHSTIPLDDRGVCEHAYTYDFPSQLCAVPEYPVPSYLSLHIQKQCVHSCALKPQVFLYDLSWDSTVSEFLALNALAGRPGLVSRELTTLE